jgi:predicted ATPase
MELRYLSAVLATSCEPMGVAGERVVPLTGLGIAEAVGLFCDRVMAVDDTVTVSADERACGRVDL